jgi:hypothetical protein
VMIELHRAMAEACAVCLELQRQTASRPRRAASAGDKAGAALRASDWAWTSISMLGANDNSLASAAAGWWRRPTCIPVPCFLMPAPYSSTIAILVTYESWMRSLHTCMRVGVCVCVWGGRGAERRRTECRLASTL